MSTQQAWMDVEDAIYKMVTHETGTATDKKLSDAKWAIIKAVQAFGEAVRAEERATERLHMTDWMSRREAIRLTAPPKYFDALLADIARGAHRPGVK